MFEYLKDKINKATNNVEVKSNIAKGMSSIGYIDLNSTVSFDLSATIILADLDQTGKTLPLIVKDYKESGVIKKMIKEKISDTTYSLRCFFDSELENFIQINVIENQIDSATVFKRYERIFYNKAKEVFIDKNGDEYPEELWSENIIGDKMFFIDNGVNRFEYDRVYSSKEVYESIIKGVNNYSIVADIEECLYHRGIESDYINREIVLVSHLETNEEKTINIYTGLDVSLASLKIT